MKNISLTDKDFMQLALAKARESAVQGGFPAGAIVVQDGKVIGEGLSLGNKLHDPSSHGDMAAIRKACAHVQSSDLKGATLYASLQPCVMCFGASMCAGIGRIVYACPQEKLSAEYYGGHYHIESLNAALLKPIEMTHLAECEAEALDIVRAWERTVA